MVVSRIPYKSVKHQVFTVKLANKKCISVNYEKLRDIKIQIELFSQFFRNKVLLLVAMYAN